MIGRVEVGSVVTRMVTLIGVGALCGGAAHAAVQVGVEGGGYKTATPNTASGSQGIAAGLRAAVQIGSGFAPEILASQARTLDDSGVVLNQAYLGTRYFLGKRMVVPFLSAHGGYTSAKVSCEACDGLDPTTAFAARGGAGVQIGLGLLYLEGLASYGMIFGESSNASLMQAGIGLGIDL